MTRRVGARLGLGALVDVPPSVTVAAAVVTNLQTRRRRQPPEPSEQPWQVQATFAGWWPPEAAEMLAVTSELEGVGQVVALLQAALPSALWPRVREQLEAEFGVPLPGSGCDRVPGQDALW